MKKLILGTCLLTMTIQSALALDVITSPIQIFTRPCSNYLRYDYASAFCFSQKISYSMVGNGKGHGDMNVFAYIIALPFTLLDEDTKQFTIDSSSLLAQGYSEEDLQNYKDDIELVEEESDRRRISNASMAKALIEELILNERISNTTIEIMGL